MRIRPVEPADVETIRDVDAAAGRLFAGIGMDDVAAHAPQSAEELFHYQRAGRAWVAVDGERVVAFVLVDVVDGAGHVEQISVHPDAARRGVGARLLDTVADWAKAQGLGALTLITFGDVAWNGPYYQRLGFRVLGDDDVGPELRGLRQVEAAKGLDGTRRVCMRRRL